MKKIIGMGVPVEGEGGCELRTPPLIIDCATSCMAMHYICKHDNSHQFVLHFELVYVFMGGYCTRV